MISVSQHINIKESPCTLRATGGWGFDPSAEAALPAADFARIVRASRGAHCRPLHPRLASLCSAPKAALAGPGSGVENRAGEFHGNREPRQPGFDDS